MFGFSITVNGKVSAKEGDINYRNIVCSNYMIKKFEEDKIFAETEDCIILLDGVVLNQKSLLSSKHDKLKELNNSSWANLLIELYQKKGEQFFSILRGSFAGALYDKKLEKWIIFGDQIGSKFIYYSKVGDFFCCSQVMGYMYELLRENHIDYHLSSVGVLLMLTYGYMLDDKTLCEEVHKINPGCYITYQNGILKEHRHYLVDNTPDDNITEDAALEIVDNLFRQAVVREFEKDKEYGYKHLVALSGGLDCRMTSFVAHDCGYTNQLNMTFSQSEYWDQVLPMRMARDLKHEWIYKALDNGLWLYDVDEITRTTGGNVLYYGSAHSNSLFKYLNLSTLGLEHSGQIGDVVIGSFITSQDKNKKYKLGAKAYSVKYLDKIKDFTLLLDANMEIGMFYYRAFHGTNNGLQNIYNYTETLSPFLDLDFLEQSLAIPVEIRQNHRLYKKWILKYYPQAAQYEWESIGCKITSPVLHIGDREIPMRNIPASIKSHVKKALGISLEKDTIQSSMNPLAYYLNSNKELSKFLDSYFDYVDAIDIPQVRNILLDFQKNGTAMERIEAVSLLSAVKLFYA